MCEIFLQGECELEGGRKDKFFNLNSGTLYTVFISSNRKIKRNVKLTAGFCREMSKYKSCWLTCSSHETPLIAKSLY